MIAQAIAVQGNTNFESACMFARRLSDRWRLLAMARQYDAWRLRDNGIVTVPSLFPRHARAWLILETLIQWVPFNSLYPLKSSQFW
jgi:hypothetical protein